MDEDLKLVERLRARVSNPTLMEEAVATITRLHAEIEALKSDVSDLVRAGSDEATEVERLREALFWIGEFSAMRGADPENVFRKVARNALAEIATKARAASRTLEGE